MFTNCELGKAAGFMLAEARSLQPIASQNGHKLKEAIRQVKCRVGCLITGKLTRACGGLTSEFNFSSLWATSALLENLWAECRVRSPVGFATCKAAIMLALVRMSL